MYSRLLCFKGCGQKCPRAGGFLSPGRGVLGESLPELSERLLWIDALRLQAVLDFVQLLVSLHGRFLDHTADLDKKQPAAIDAKVTL